VFDKVVLDITQKKDSENITAKVMIRAKPFTMSHYNGIIQSVSRDA